MAGRPTRAWTRTKSRTPSSASRPRAQKGEAANPDKVERLLLTLGGMADDIFQVTAATLTNPVLGLAKTIQLIAQKAKEEKKKRDAGGE